MRITEKDRKLIRSALNDAMDERDSFADAYSRQGPEAQRAIKRVAEYEALHLKLFGEPSARAQEQARFAAMPTVSIHDVGKGEKK